MKIYKKIISFAICVLMTLAIYSYICLIVMPKSSTDSGGTRYFRGKGFLAEPKNSIDVMVYGNSDVYSGFSPATLFDKFGYTSYASGAALQSITQINKLLSKTFDIQKPKIVVLDVDCLYNGSSYSAYSSSFFVSPFVFHSRWKELKGRDFYTVPNMSKKYDITKGHVASNDVFESENINYMGKELANPHPISRSNYREVMTFIKKCRSQGAKVVFLELPSATSWTYAKHNYIKQLAENNNIPFIDLNIKQNGYSVDFTKDFRDNGNHLNSAGAAKATEFIGKYICDSYPELLSDKRNVKDYNFWFDVVNHYNNELAKK